MEAEDQVVAGDAVISDDEEVTLFVSNRMPYVLINSQQETLKYIGLCFSRVIEQAKLMSQNPELNRQAKAKIYIDIK